MTLKIDSNSYRSQYFSSRKIGAKIEFVIFHFTELDFDQTINVFLGKSIINNNVSAHYVIDENGKIFNLVPTEKKAWHAGISNWQGKENLNDYSIGIELVNDGKSPFTKQQIDACIELSKRLKKEYAIPSCNFIGHQDVAPTRKLDPGCLFPWELFAQNGIGIWGKWDSVDHSDTNFHSSYNILLRFNDEGEKVAALQNKLQRLGYVLKVDGVFGEIMNSIIKAFQGKFFQEKILASGGMEFFQNEDSLFTWDSASEARLDQLLYILSHSAPAAYEDENKKM